MSDYTWRQSGRDAQRHAFTSESGFIRSAIYSLPELGSAEYHVTVCGEVLPLAFVMPRDDGATCGICLQLMFRPRPWLSPVTADRDVLLARQ